MQECLDATDPGENRQTENRHNLETQAQSSPVTPSVSVSDTVCLSDADTKQNLQIKHIQLFLTPSLFLSVSSWQSNSGSQFSSSALQEKKQTIKKEKKKKISIRKKWAGKQGTMDGRTARIFTSAQVDGECFRPCTHEKTSAHLIKQYL